MCESGTASVSTHVCLQAPAGRFTTVDVINGTNTGLVPAPTSSCCVSANVQAGRLQNQHKQTPASLPGQAWAPGGWSRSSRLVWVVLENGEGGGGRGVGGWGGDEI